MKKLMPYIKPHIWMILLTLLIKFLATTAELMIPRLMETIIDDAVPYVRAGGKMSVVFLYGGGMLLFAIIGFTCYISLGAFLIGCLGISDAFHIYTPLLDDTPLTTWVMAPLYAVAYALILFIIEFVRKRKSAKTNSETN